MPALQVTVRELARSRKRLREKALHVELPASGDALAALLAALAAPARSRVAFSVRNARPLQGDAVLGRLAHCHELARLKPREPDSDAESDSESSEHYVPDVGLKVAASVNEAGRRERALILATARSRRRVGAARSREPSPDARPLTRRSHDFYLLPSGEEPKSLEFSTEVDNDGAAPEPDAALNDALRAAAALGETINAQIRPAAPVKVTLAIKNRVYEPTTHGLPASTTVADLYACVAELAAPVQKCPRGFVASGNGTTITASHASSNELVSHYFGCYDGTMRLEVRKRLGSMQIFVKTLTGKTMFCALRVATQWQLTSSP